MDQMMKVRCSPAPSLITKVYECSFTSICMLVREVIFWVIFCDLIHLCYFMQGTSQWPKLSLCSFDWLPWSSCWNFGKLLSPLFASVFLLQLQIVNCLRKNPLAMVQIREGLHYNPYFPGGAIAMPKMLNDEAVEYEDGTSATEAQVGFLLLITDLRDFIELIVY